MAGERERLTAQGVLPPLAVATFRRAELRFEAELRWHDEFERHAAVGQVGKLASVGSADDRAKGVPGAAFRAGNGG